MAKGVLARLDRAVDDFCRRTRYFREDMTKGRARMFAMQHRLNTRQRNSVLKLRVATNCPDWDTRIGIIRACSEEVIADHEHGRGRAHWEILGLGTRIGLAQRNSGREAHREHAACLVGLGRPDGEPSLARGIVANTAPSAPTSPATAPGP
jgi:hypothetical protein